MTPVPDSLRMDVLSVQEVQIEIAYEGRVEERVRDSRSRHPFYTFWCIQEGVAEVTHGSSHWSIRAGHWLLMPPHFERRQLLAPDTRLISLSFNWSWPLARHVLAFAPVIHGRVNDQPALCERAQEAVRALGVQDEAPRPASRSRQMSVPQFQIFQSRLHAFLASVCEVVLANGGEVTPPHVMDPRLEYVLSRLSAQPRAGPLPYDQWRPSVGLGRVQIERLAQQHLGMSLHAWRNHRLAREVRRRLLAGSVVIKTVAAEMGFVDSAHFHRWVKQHLGLIPSEIQRRIV